MEHRVSHALLPISNAPSPANAAMTCNDILSGNQEGIFKVHFT
jgi:hypothetical protein